MIFFTSRSRHTRFDCDWSSDVCSADLEVPQPGAYRISSLGTVLTGLYAAGGVTERANMRGIQIQRLSKTVATLDLYDYLLRGDSRNDIRLETGGVVFVSGYGPRGQISGGVLRSAIYA